MLDRTILGDAKLNIAMLQTFPIALFQSRYIFNQTITWIFRHVGFVRLQSCSERLAGFSGVNLSGVWTDYTDYWVLHCLRAAGASGCRDPGDGFSPVCCCRDPGDCLSLVLVCFLPLLLSKDIWSGMVTISAKTVT